MKDLFNPTVHNEFVERINKVTPESKAQWGKMNSAQMMAHVSEAFKSALGQEKLKRSFIGFWFGKMAKKSFIGGKPFKQNLPTAPQFKITNEREFEKEKKLTLDLINQFCTGGPEKISSHPHTFFGKMSPDEWNKLMSNHLDHHLKQFGV